MKRELGIARCGLACCPCSENISCQGCDSGEYPDKDWCQTQRSTDCLERNEKNGIVYHREGINGDYDEFDDVEKLIMFIKEGIQ